MNRFSIFELNALTITLLYLIVSLGWVFFSDAVLEWAADDYSQLSYYQTLKGFLFIFLSSGLFYLLIKHSNDKLYAEKRHINNALQAASMATWSINIHNHTGTFTNNSHSFLGFGDAAKEWSLQDFLNIIHPDDREIVRRRYYDSIQTGAQLDVEYRVITKENAIRWMKSLGTLKEGADEDISHLMGVVVDITSQKELAHKYYKGKELFERIFDTIPVMLSIYDPDLERTRVNQAIEKILGWTSEDFQQKDFMSLFFPDENDRDEILKFMAQADGSWHELEIQTRQKEKRIQRWCNIKLSSDITIGIGHDITEQKNLEKKLEKERIELQKSKKRYQRAEQIAKIGHWQRNIENDEAIWSDGVFELLELEKGKDSQSFENLVELIHPEDRQQFFQAYQEAKHTGYFNTQFRLYKRKSGIMGYYRGLGELEYDEQENMPVLRGTIQDITELKRTELELKVEKQRFEIAANATSDVIWDLDVENNNIWWSSDYEKLFGFKINEASDPLLEWAEHVHPDDVERVVNELQQTLESDATKWSEKYRIVKADGSVSFVNDHGIILRNDEGKATQMIGSIEDITEKKLAKEKLQESEHKYRQLFEKNPQPMWIYNPQNLRFVEVNEAAIHHYGYNKDEFMNMTIDQLRPNNKEADTSRLVTTAYKNRNATYSSEFVHVKKDGSKTYVSISSSDISYKKDTYRIVLAADITEQVKAEERVIASFVEGENRERKRVAQELHDGLGQYLAAANMNIDAVKDSITELSEKQHQQFLKGLDFLQHAIVETRNISHNLMPQAVEEYGLPLAVQALVDNYKKSTEIEFYFYHNMDAEFLEDEIAINIYRIAQEALSNAVKYAKASKINLQLVKDDLDLILTIDDNGIGYDVTDSNFEAGLGLQTMKTRTDALGGSLEIETTPGRGTLIQVLIPIRNKK